jgi:hypothetical protein
MNRPILLCGLAVALLLAAISGVSGARKAPPSAAAPRLTVQRVSRAAYERGPVTVPTTTTTTTAPPTTTTTADVIPAERTVFIVGDSLTEGANPFLADALKSVRWAASGIDFGHGRKTPAGLAVLAAHRHELPPTVLVALGTNDLDATADDVVAWMHQARVLVGNRRLIWVNLDLRDETRYPTYPAINAALAVGAAREHIELADWHAWARAHGVRHIAEGVHYDLDGYHQRANFYAEVLAGQH